MSRTTLSETLGLGGLEADAPPSSNVVVDASALDTDHRTRGIGRYVSGLVSGLDEIRGDEPSMRYLRLGGPLQRRFGPGSDDESIAGGAGEIDDRDILRIQRPPGPHVTRWLINEWQLPSELSGTCELFHATEPGAICTGPDYKTVVTMHDVIPLMFPDVYMRFPSYVFWPLYFDRLEDEGRWEAIDHVIAISEATKTELQNHLDIPPDKISVVYNGIDHDQFQPVDDPARIREFRRDTNLPERFILYLGGDDYRKNLDVLVRALPHVPDDVELVLAGGLSGASRDRLETLADDLRVADRLVFPGYIDDADVPTLYAAASVFAYPSMAEGFGLQLLEAMAVGCPVVASDRSSLSEVVGDAGLTVDPMDPAELGAALARCLEDETLAAELERRGLDRASEFSWERCAEETLEVYREVLE
jgi:glycosyltransferase involved in cell wall biosynthesis